MADVYGAITDDAVNRIINFLHARVPFLFNYVAPSLRVKDGGQGIEEVWLTCSDVPQPSDVNIPRFTRMAPFKLPGIPVGLPLSIQLIDLNVDCHPGDQVKLPAELGVSLPAQAFAIQAFIQFGVPCIPPTLADSLAASRTWGARLPVLPVDQLDCFVIQVVATGRTRVDTVPGGTQPVQQIRVDILGIEIIDISPTGLENAIECYLVAVLKAYILPNLLLELEPLVVNTLGLKTITPSLSPGLPHNPAIEANELRVWLDLDIK